ncbi:beta-lactamase/transpeptidase-like protein [Xylariaceae sp. FL0016]|nr:beta-lactamase/transpeptidase-like protein [Xylariaceae sp. FL0016]
MRRYQAPLLLALTCSSGIQARFLGPIDPAPIDISSDGSFVRQSWENLTATLESSLNGTAPSDELAGLHNVTFSIGAFSINDPAVAGCFQYHHASPDVVNSTLGVNKVDGDSIYRIASLTKVVTVYAGLLQLKPEDWSTPLSEIFPEIASLPQDDPLVYVQWDHLTPLALASQISGIPRDAAPFNPGELYGAVTDPASTGLPVLSPNDPVLNLSCVSPTCSAVDYIRGIQTQTPLFLPWQTLGYADTNFILLGLVISKLTGLTYEEFYRQPVFDPLGMAHTSSISPTPSNTTIKPYPGYVVTGSPAAFSFQGGITSSSSGLFSTTNDLARLGTSILNATLLSPTASRA